MPEETRTISDARGSLPSLSEAAAEKLDRFIITNQGRPQSVLLGYEDYQSLRAATQILQQPGVLDDIQTGLKQLEEGEELTLDEVGARLRERAEGKRGGTITDAIAEQAGVDEQTVAAVLRSFADVAMRTKTRVDVPGLGMVRVLDRGSMKAARRRRRAIVVDPSEQGAA